MSFHKVRIIFLIWASQSALILYLFIAQDSNFREKEWTDKRALVNRFLLTDYCLTTESRHTRHISMPELFAPFQDLPASHEHFPSSSFFWVDKTRFEDSFQE